MTREEAINVLENPDVSIGVAARIGQDPEYWRKLKPALGMAISALRQKGQERNAPLTLDEMRRMEGQPVYIVENTEYWAIVNSFDQAGVYLLSYGNPDDYGYFGFYGKTWLAYRQKPEEGTV